MWPDLLEAPLLLCEAGMLSGTQHNTPVVENANPNTQIPQKWPAEQYTATLILSQEWGKDVKVVLSTAVMAYLGC